MARSSKTLHENVKMFPVLVKQLELKPNRGRDLGHSATYVVRVWNIQTYLSGIVFLWPFTGKQGLHLGSNPPAHKPPDHSRKYVYESKKSENRCKNRKKCNLL